MKTKEEWHKYYTELVEKAEKEAENDVANGYEPKRMPLFVLNQKETEDNLFPHSQWELKLMQGDGKPARFHAIRNGWDVTFSIDSGDVLEILSGGAEKADFGYMCGHIKEWLEAQSTLLDDCQNKMFTKIIWHQFFSL